MGWNYVCVSNPVRAAPSINEYETSQLSLILEYLHMTNFQLINHINAQIFGQKICLIVCTHHVRNVWPGEMRSIS